MLYLHSLFTTQFAEWDACTLVACSTRSPELLAIPRGNKQIFYALPVSVTEFPQQTVDSRVESVDCRVLQATQNAISKMQPNIILVVTSTPQLTLLPTTHTPMPPWQLRGRSCIPPPSLVFCRACRPCKHRVGCLGCVGMGLLVPWSVWDSGLLFCRVPVDSVECRRRNTLRFPF